ncbi:hypothetical protein GXW76_20370 [Roseomonas soli]|uniref:Uncharacterized protein n=2 Tax=Neoroseomonas soli TaxID=1081025 RepID=A0A9X9X2A9_9PROT|nr:hypothetical protein [Neoroseomonas soli]
MNAEPGLFLTWPQQKDAVLAHLRANPAPLKILLKTRNDAALLERWITHHLAIAGPGNLIVFDNGSTDPGVLEIYRRHHAQILLARYDGFFDNLHRVAMFEDLYAALQAGKGRFVFLDTDEFLVWMEPDGTVLRDARLVQRLREVDAPVLPGTWLHNLLGFDDRFWLLPDGQGLVEGLTWGKPLIRHDVALSGVINHNSQLPLGSYRDRFRANCFVLHLNRLSAQQRIGANLNKLVAMQALPEGTTAAQAARLNVENFREGNIRLYLREVQQLVSRPQVAPDIESPLLPNSMRLLRDGALRFQAPAQEETLRRFLLEPASFMARAFAGQVAGAA